jgi:two-component system cell cycle sensor histidine kinase/response regulator CckA
MTGDADRPSQVGPRADGPRGAASEDQINQMLHNLSEKLRLTQAALNESQRASRMGNWSWDALTNAVRWSDELLRIFDAAPGTSPPRYPELLKNYTPESADRLRSAMEHTLSTGVGYEFDLERAPGTGAVRWLATTGEAIRDEKGQVVGLRGTAQDITARKQTEERLHASEQRLRLALRGGDLGMWDLDVRTGAVAVNDRWLTMLGLDPLETNLNLMLWRSLVHPDDQPRLERQYNEVFLNPAGVDFEIEIRARHAAGHYVWILDKGAVVERDRNGNPVRVVGTHLDISHQTQQRESEHFLLEAVDRFPGMLAYWTRDLRCPIANPAYVQWFGRTQEQLHNMHYQEWLGKSLFQNNQEPLAAVLRGEDQQFERQVIKPDGSLAHALVHYIARRSNGDVVGFFAYVIDVTAVRRYQDQLRTSDVALNSISQGVIICGPDRRIIWVNDAFGLITGYVRSAILGHTCKFLQGPLTNPKTVNAIRQALNDGNEFAAEILNYRKDGASFWNEMTISPARTLDGRITHFIGVTRDVTHRKAAEEQKARLEAQLGRAQKLESIGRLAGGIAHDFNNMLTVILGHSELALDRSNVAQPVRAALEEIHKAAGRSAELTHQLLAFASKQTVAPRVLDLNQTVSGMSRIIERLLSERIDLTWRLHASPCLVKLDPSQIDQIIMNLCVNARDAIPGQGRIIIETGNRTLGSDGTSHPVEASPGEYVWLAVSDNGCGMDQETQSHIFEPFFTTKETGKGTGLGLATVYGAVRQNAGCIDVHSNPGKGTTLTVYLPRHDAQGETAQTQHATPPDEPCHETILVAENEPAILKLATAILQAQGYNVLAACSPQAALCLADDYAGQEPSPIHLLLADLIMPEMNGVELARKVTALHPRIKRLFMSGYATEVISAGGGVEEHAGFIAKPFDKQRLLKSVREVLDGAAYEAEGM